jgi:hypothetical protein
MNPCAVQRSMVVVHWPVRQLATDSKNRMESAIFRLWQSVSVLYENRGLGKSSPSLVHPPGVMTVVYAESEQQALAKAIEQFQITKPHEQKKLMVRPQR